MSIVSLKKVTLLGMSKDKTPILSSLQDAGCLHLISLKPGQSNKAKLENVKNKADEAHTALRFLSDSSIIRKQITRKETFDVKGFVKEVVDVKQALRLANDKRDFLLNRIRLFEPWGDIYFPPHEDLKGYRMWFYVVPHNKTQVLEQVKLPWQVVSKSNRFAYVVLISKDEPDEHIMPVPRSHLGSAPLSELRLQLEDIEVEIENLTTHREELTRYLYLFRLHLNDADNEAILQNAHEFTRDQDQLVIVQGWVPNECLKRLEDVCNQFDCAFVAEDVTEEDQPPTLIEQSDDMAASKDLALFYQVPDYRAWDPSKLLFFSFSMFFAMILADAGYGMLLLGMLLMSKTKLLTLNRGKAYFNLGVSLCVFTLIYGAMVGSYFGMAPEQGSVLAKIQVLDLKDFNTMMTLSIVIGVAHISLANILLLLSSSSWHFKLSRVGWVGLITSALLYWLHMDSDLVKRVLTITTALSSLLILLFSSVPKQPGIKHGLFALKDGLLSLAGVMTAFGDVLSYMRLFALGLASASLAQTFNQLAEQTYESAPGIGLLASILILAIGHFLNLLLSLISGLVHGLRLNYIEFYKWGLPKEGIAFQKFAKKEIEK